ncbi:MAG: hypothetical protein QM756_46470 [Polyangiaceae bacterium]
MLKVLLRIGLGLVVASSALGGCSDVKNTITCSEVCNRYKGCFDSSYDVSACTDRCKTRAGSDSDKQSQLDQCDACIEDKSCASATFSCATECVSIVP